MKLILISPSGRKDSEISSLLNMFEMGLMTYHLRKINFSTEQLKDFIAEIPEKYHKRIVIHTAHRLAVKFNLQGIYISRLHKKSEYRTWLWIQWFKLTKRELQISATFRSIERILEYDSKYEYVLLSPVFPTISGNFQSGFSEPTLRAALQDTKYKVVARGGASCENLHIAHELGFYGVALHSSIWRTKNPSEEFKKLKEKFNELKIPME